MTNGNVAQTETQLEDELILEDAEGLDNPLSLPLVRSFRLLRRTQQSRDGYREALKAAIELLHSQRQEILSLRTANIRLVEEIRVSRREAPIAA